jgi:hypothetical protein
MKKVVANRQTLTVVVVLFLLVFFSLRQDLSAYIPPELSLYTSAQIPKGNRYIAQYSNLTSIRQWGCHRPETPLIFVHIGKSGGGTIRARFAAAAENFTRSSHEGWKRPTEDNHYYPVLSNFSNGTQVIQRGRFCTSKNRHYRMPKMRRFTNNGYEGIFDCHATTPLGRMIGCPSFWFENDGCGGCTDINAPDCHTVYVGHNYFGNELHWLPAPYIQNWWNKNWASVVPFPEVKNGLRSISVGTTDPIWCTRHNKSRTTKRNDVLAGRQRRESHTECSKDISNRMDAWFRASWKAIVPNSTSMDKNYAPIYASMPLHRTVLLREPFSWLVSRFFWDSVYRTNYKCDDIEKATYFNPLSLNHSESGWVYQMALEHLFYLCGEDCINRYETGEINLNDIERQAEANLRHSFSVVGLLNETASFYEMVTTRIQVRRFTNRVSGCGVSFNSNDSSIL